MRTLQAIDSDIQVHIDALAELASERAEVIPNPFVVQVIPQANAVAIVVAPPKADVAPWTR